MIQAVAKERADVFLPKEKIDRLIEQVNRVIIGKEETIRFVVAALCARGHILIEDIPGVGKTTLARTLARSMDLSFQRIQFTPDLLPSDVLGVSIYNHEERTFEFKQGPIFSHIVLADEINRATPRTQSSLLEAMNEFQVSIDRHTYPLPQPFMVLATQNPVEFKGTYPLPESQLDRFLMKVRLGYPDLLNEKQILSSRTRENPLDRIEPVLTAEDILGIQSSVGQIHIQEEILDYILSIVQATRINTHLKTGVSPRGSLALTRAVQALALISGRDYCIPDDVKKLATSILAHRVIPKMSWKEGWLAEDLMAEIVHSVPVPL